MRRYPGQVRSFFKFFYGGVRDTPPQLSLALGADARGVAYIRE
jgi:hypothetical protein